ncbi:MAG: glycosyltransferase family 39 protein, partial [Leadbetterella sp.]|nr:glycosyltransferase family 39 protein [Leadbetterella sp.]
MHVDEAVHAIKFGYLLENNYYRYNPVEYHGPTLNYFSLIPAWILGEKNISEVTEATLRIVPVLAGLLLLCLIFLLKDIGKDFVLVTLIFTGFSSLIVFYNRYYIQESLLVSFSFSGMIAYYSFRKTNKVCWLITSAVLFGLTFTSKETSIITFFGIALSVFILKMMNKTVRFKFSINRKNVFLFILTFAITAILFFASFFTNLHGALDSVLTFTNYFGKAENNAEHIHPFYYYFSLVSFRTIDEVFFSELLILFFFIFGLIRVFSKANKNSNGMDFIKFISIFTIIVTFIYSAIPYKTP